MILVTGATGFLGAQLAKQLAENGVAIRCTRRASSVLPIILDPYSALIEWVNADICDLFSLEDAMQGVKQVYHCAAWVSFKQADKEPMISTNINGTANVVNACLTARARLVHVSSVAALGSAKPGELITEKNYIEDTPVDNIYAISKLESEMEVWRGIAEGLDAVIVNPSIIIGAGAGTQGSGKLFETVRKGLSFYTGGSCGFVDAEDVARCMIILMNSNITGERFIINAENRNYRELLTTVARSFNVKPPTRNAKPWMMEFAWRTASVIGSLTGKDPALDKIAAQGASLTQNFDNSKIKSAIGFEFKPLDQTINNIVMALN